MNKSEQERSFELRAIGRVMVQEGEGCLLQIDEPFRAALKQLDQFSHLMVFWWADKVDREDLRAILTTELPYASGVEAGVFSCRSEYRPNPVAITTVPILEVNLQAGTVVIPWIDALDGSPLIDLKPYIPCCDRIRDVEGAPWTADWPMWAEEADAYFSEHETDFGE